MRWHQKKLVLFPLKFHHLLLMFLRTVKHLKKKQLVFFVLLNVCCFEGKGMNEREIFIKKNTFLVSESRMGFHGSSVPWKNCNFGPSSGESWKKSGLSSWKRYQNFLFRILEIRKFWSWSWFWRR